MKKITPEIETAILKDYADGLGGTTIAKRYGISKKMVQLIRERHGVAPRPLGVRGRRYTLNHGAFAGDTPEIRYWVGALITDGCVHWPRKGAGAPKIILQVHEKDAGWIEDFRSFLGYSGPIYRFKAKTKSGEMAGPYPRIAVASQQLAEDLGKWGITPKKTYIARAPEKLKADPDFWRGVIDGDGHIETRKRGLLNCGLCGWGDLVRDFKSVVKTVVDADAPAIESTDKNGSRWLSVTVYSKNAYRLLAWLYDRAGPRLARKGELAQALLTEFKNHPWRKSPKR